MIDIKKTTKFGGFLLLEFSSVIFATIVVFPTINGKFHSVNKNKRERHRGTNNNFINNSEEG